MYYRGKLAHTQDPTVLKFERTYTPKKINRTMTKKRFNETVYPRFQEFLSMKNSKVETKKLENSMFAKSPVKIPKGSRLQREQLSFQERNREFQFIKKEKLRFLKREAEIRREKALNKFTYKPKLKARSKHLRRELEDLFLWQEDKNSKLAKLQKEKQEERLREQKREEKEIEQRRRALSRRNRKNWKRAKKRAVSSNQTER